MNPPATRRPRVRTALILVGLALGWASPAAPASGARTVEPAQVVPLDKIAPQHRDAVAEVIRDHTIHRKSTADTFPCNSRLYLSLLNEPAISLALWQDLASSPVRLSRIDANRYQGTDGNGATASWEFVYRSPRLTVLLSDLDYSSPRGAAHLNGRIVLIVHSGFFREVNGDPWVQHDIEAFVKVDSKGWKTLAKTVRPILEKVLEDQVQEAGLFVSLMGRLVETYPTWACQVVTSQPQIDSNTRTAFRDLVTQTKKPGAATGRPVMTANATTPPPSTDPTRRR